MYAQGFFVVTILVMTELTLLGDPKSTQHCYKYRWTGKFLHSYMDKKCVDLKTSYQDQLAIQWKRKPLKSALQVRLKLYHGTKHKKDIDNFSKLILDAMTGIVYEDDNQIEELHISKHYDKANPRADLQIYVI